LETFRPSQRFVSSYYVPIAWQGCDPNGNFSIVVHGWLESINTTWANSTVFNLLQYRGGCVFFMDYSAYSKVEYYYKLVSHFTGISNSLLRKVNQIGRNDQLYLFGFSFGSRLCMDVGVKVGNQSISRMDLCERAGEYQVLVVNMSLHC